MTGNEIGVEGAKTMSEMFQFNSTLTSLDLRCGKELKEKIEKRRKGKEG